MKASEKLLSTGKYLTVFELIVKGEPKVAVRFEGSFVINEDGDEISTFGTGQNFESACDDYLVRITGKKLRFYDTMTWDRQEIIIV